MNPVVISDLLRLADASATSWAPFRAGIEIHRLYLDESTGASAALLRYQPGGAVPRHRHAGHEHILVLAGEQEDERGRYGAGALVINPPGSVHSVRSGPGCLVLIIWERPIVFEP